MQYKSKTIVRELPSHLRSLGVALSKPPSASLYSAISRASFKSKKLRQALINHTCQQLNKQCLKVVKMKKSVLRSTSIQDLKCFKWSKLLNEWRKEAPILLRVLRTVTGNSTTTRESLKPFICAAGAILLKGRNQRMSAVQHLVGLCLFLGRTRKKV